MRSFLRAHLRKVSAPEPTPSSWTPLTAASSLDDDTDDAWPTDDAVADRVTTAVWPSPALSVAEEPGEPEIAEGSSADRATSPSTDEHAADADAEIAADEPDETSHDLERRRVIAQAQAHALISSARARAAGIVAAAHEEADSIRSEVRELQAQAADELSRAFEEAETVRASARAERDRQTAEAERMVQAMIEAARRQIDVERAHAAAELGSLVKRKAGAEEEARRLLARVERALAADSHECRPPAGGLSPAWRRAGRP